MSEPTAFDEIRLAAEEGGVPAALEGLAERYRSEGNFPGVFEARLMKMRLELGAPAMHQGPLENLSDDARKRYEQAQLDAAREVGTLFLEAGDLYRAWPYYRALGETETMAEALEKARPSADEVDGLVEIGFHEKVNPRRGFELILEHYGTCRAITNFPHFPVEEGKQESARLLVDTLSAEVAANLGRAIEAAEGRAPSSGSIAELIDGRDWLFEGNACYVDSSHVASIVQMAPEWRDEDTLRRVIELTEYGRRLGEMYQVQSDPPFEDAYVDHGFYLRALVGEEVDEAVAHFRAKISTEPDPFGNVPAQVLVRLLLRVERPDEAAETAVEYLSDTDPQYLTCPSPMELCVAAGDAAGLETLARKKGDLLAYAAALDLSGCE